jgi:hypothetical protein
MAECLIKRDANREIVAVMDSASPTKEDQNYKSVLESFIAEGAEDNGPTREKALDLYLITKLNIFLRNKTKILNTLSLDENNLFNVKSLRSIKSTLSFMLASHRNSDEASKISQYANNILSTYGITEDDIPRLPLEILHQMNLLDSRVVGNIDVLKTSESL